MYRFLERKEKFNMVETMLIGTHNSATGEKSGSLLSWLLTPFAKCQSKTIKQQYEAGCRLFDIRIKWINNAWHCAHGVWYTKKYVSEILHEINGFPESCYVSITYEGKLNGEQEKHDLLLFFHWAQTAFPNIKLGPLAAKYSDDGVSVDWTILDHGLNSGVKTQQGFIPLDGKHWQTYLPIPWLWNKIYTRKHIFNNDVYTFVDFL